jgi:hypothetical protein
MQSAFGIDHGSYEISKARRRKAQPYNPPKQSAFSRHVGIARQVPGKVANANISLNEIGGGISRGAQATGRGIGRVLGAKPGLTGAVVVGGGGYGLYRAGQPRKPKKGVARKPEAMQ